MTSECLIQNIVAQIQLAKATRKFGEDSRIEIFLNNRAYSMLMGYCGRAYSSKQTLKTIYGHRVHVVHDVDSGVPEFWLGEKCELREFDT